MSVQHQDASAPHHHYRLCAAGPHVWVLDPGGGAARLGAIRAEAGRLAYRLQLDGLQGDGFLTSEKLLQDIAAKLAYASLHRFFGTAAPAPAPADVLTAPYLIVENEEPGQHPPPGSAAE